MTGSSMTRIGAAVLLSLCGLAGAEAGPMPVSPLQSASPAPIAHVQYYGYPPYGDRRPYGFYRPYGYGPGPRYFGPGAAKERFITRRDYCRNRPERCR